MAEDVLRPYPQARERRRERAFADLLDWLDGHPLSLRLLLPQLETVSAATLLDGLKGNTANLPPGFVGEGRLASLGASLLQGERANKLTRSRRPPRRSRSTYLAPHPITPTTAGQALRS